MPKRTDITKVLVIGSGPIQIGQACEFDYSGTQAIKALREEGLKTVLVNSNPATIMTDPDFADVVYIEPLTVESLTKIIESERPDALLPTVGGQTALNLAMALDAAGVLKKYAIRLIGADVDAIRRAEDRQTFKDCMTGIGLKVPQSDLAYTVAEAKKQAAQIGYPIVVRPAFTLGGSGGGIAQNESALEQLAEWGLRLSPIGQILVEKSVAGWKEFELEVMRDCRDNVVIVCSIENLDPMGVHTGDSITVAPIQTLTDKEYQVMRDAAIKAIRAIGVEAGGCNVQFAVNPDNGELVMIEINPRVSRSSALASKATGFPIARIAAKLACGYTLDELPNDITKKTPASFEPTLDYVVTKIPRFTFEKFFGTPALLTTQMKSVGEVMAIGRTFKESLLKALRSLEQDCYGLEMPLTYQGEFLLEDLKEVRPQRFWQIAEALRQGISVETIFQMTKIDRWFLRQIDEIVQEEKFLSALRLRQLTPKHLKKAKEMGLSDRRIAFLLNTEEGTIRNLRREQGLIPTYKTVDTCAAEFQAFTPYLYSTYEPEEEFPPSQRPKVVILGSGPNRIGQGIEFDYCCVHAALSFRELGFETIMINCNPETVSTDYDISDRLYFEPLTFEDVMNIVEKEKPNGVVIQFGGQTPLKLALSLSEAGVPILGTHPKQIDRAEDRAQFKQLIDTLGLKQPKSGMAADLKEAKILADQIGYPVLVRPSYVLGGSAMGIVADPSGLQFFLEGAKRVSPKHPVLIDQYLQNAIEVDVDAVCDGTDVVIAGIMEHIEEAGIHSGDSSCVLPPQNFSADLIRNIEKQTRALALALETQGLINIQFAIQEGVVFVLEVNPRGSRTIPFVSKATGIPWAKVAAKVLAGEKLKSMSHTSTQGNRVAVKSPVFPFIKFHGVDTLLSPEMRSTGEVMGFAKDFAAAYAKAQLAAGQKLPQAPAKVFLSCNDAIKPKLIPFAKRLTQLGFEIVATRGTGESLRKNNVTATLVNKLREGSPHIVERLETRSISLVINLVETREQIADSFVIRRTALEQGIPYFNHVSQLESVLQALERMREPSWLAPMSLRTE